MGNYFSHHVPCLLDQLLPEMKQSILYFCDPYQLESFVKFGWITQDEYQPRVQEICHHLMRGRLIKELPLLHCNYVIIYEIFSFVRSNGSLLELARRRGKILPIPVYNEVNNYCKLMKHAYKNTKEEYYTDHVKRIFVFLQDFNMSNSPFFLAFLNLKSTMLSDERASKLLTDTYWISKHNGPKDCRG